MSEQMENTAVATSIAQLPAPTTVLDILGDRARALLQYAQARVVQSDEDVKLATNDLSIIARVKKALEDKRQEYVRPLNEETKRINEAFKGVSDPLSEADKLTREKILAYRSEQERKRQEAEAINRQKEELARREALLKQEITVDTTPVVVSPAPPKHVYTQMGSATATRVRKWAVEDFSKVPDDLKVIDAAKVTRLVKAGITGITGIRIWEEEALRITPTKESK